MDEMKSWAVKKAREIDEKEAEEAKKQNTYNNQQAQIGRDTQGRSSGYCPRKARRLAFSAGQGVAWYASG